MSALDACFAAYDAWRGTQPQLFWTDANLYGLDEADAGAAGLVEPAPPFPLDSAGGLDSQTYDGPGALTSKSALRGQGGAV